MSRDEDSQIDLLITAESNLADAENKLRHVEKSIGKSWDSEWTAEEHAAWAEAHERVVRARNDCKEISDEHWERFDDFLYAVNPEELGPAQLKLREMALRASRERNRQKLKSTQQLADVHQHHRVAEKAAFRAVVRGQTHDTLSGHARAYAARFQTELRNFAQAKKREQTRKAALASAEESDARTEERNARWTEIAIERVMKRPKIGKEALVTHICDTSPDVIKPNQYADIADQIKSMRPGIKKKEMLQIIAADHPDVLKYGYQRIGGNSVSRAIVLEDIRKMAKSRIANNDRASINSPLKGLSRG